MSRQPGHIGHPRHTRPGEPPEWGRRKLLILLVGLAAASALAVAGLGLGVYYMLHPATSSVNAGKLAQDDSQARSRDPRDVLAQRSMPKVGPEAARPGPLTSRPFAVLRVPSAKRLGPAGVSTGLPHTPSGALAQLIAIDQAALQSGSVRGAQRVIAAWASAGGPTRTSWSGVKAIADMLGAAGLPDSGSPSLTVSAVPAMGLIKGTVGAGYVVGCVDFVVTATMSSTASVAAADCQRMIWETTQARWVIGPGQEPAPPPSVWPGTAAAHVVGYEELRHE